MKKIIIISLISLSAPIALSMNKDYSACTEASVIKQVATPISLLPAGMGFGRYFKSSLHAGIHPRMALFKSAMVAAGTYGTTYSAFWISSKAFEFKCSKKSKATLNKTDK